MPDSIKERVLRQGLGWAVDEQGKRAHGLFQLSQADVALSGGTFAWNMSYDNEEAEHSNDSSFGLQVDIKTNNFWVNNFNFGFNNNSSASQSGRTSTIVFNVHFIQACRLTQSDDDLRPKGQVLKGARYIRSGALVKGYRIFAHGVTHSSGSDHGYDISAGIGTLGDVLGVSFSNSYKEHHKHNRERLRIVVKGIGGYLPPKAHIDPRDFKDNAQDLYEDFIKKSEGLEGSFFYDSEGIQLYLPDPHVRRLNAAYDQIRKRLSSAVMNIPQIVSSFEDLRQQFLHAATQGNKNHRTLLRDYASRLVDFLHSVQTEGIVFASDKATNQLSLFTIDHFNEQALNPVPSHAQVDEAGNLTLARRGASTSFSAHWCPSRRGEWRFYLEEMDTGRFLTAGRREGDFMHFTANKADASECVLTGSHLPRQKRLFVGTLPLVISGKDVFFFHDGWLSRRIKRIARSFGVSPDPSGGANAEQTDHVVQQGLSFLEELVNKPMSAGDKKIDYFIRQCIDKIMPIKAYGEKSGLVYVIGEKGVGKSTFINFLLGNRMRSQSKGLSMQGASKHKPVMSERRGEGETSYPEAYAVEDGATPGIVLLDTPGINERGRKEMHSLCMRLCKSLSARDKAVIVVISKAVWEVGRGAPGGPLDRLIEELTNVFAEDKLEALQPYVFFVFNPMGEAFSFAQLVKDLNGDRAGLKKTIADINRRERELREYKASKAHQKGQRKAPKEAVLDDRDLIDRERAKHHLAILNMIRVSDERGPGNVCIWSDFRDTALRKRLLAALRGQRVGQEPRQLHLRTIAPNNVIHKSWIKFGGHQDASDVTLMDAFTGYVNRMAKEVRLILSQCQEQSDHIVFLKDTIGGKTLAALFSPIIEALKEAKEPVDQACDKLADFLTKTVDYQQVYTEERRRSGFFKAFNKPKAPVEQYAKKWRPPIESIELPYSKDVYVERHRRHQNYKRVEQRVGGRDFQAKYQYNSITAGSVPRFFVNTVRGLALYDCTYTNEIANLAGVLQSKIQLVLGYFGKDTWLGKDPSLGNVLSGFYQIASLIKTNVAVLQAEPADDNHVDEAFFSNRMAACKKLVEQKRDWSKHIDALVRRLRTILGNDRLVREITHRRQEASSDRAKIEREIKQSKKTIAQIKDYCQSRKPFFDHIASSLAVVRDMINKEISWNTQVGNQLQSKEVLDQFFENYRMLHGSISTAYVQARTVSPGGVFASDDQPSSAMGGSSKAHDFSAFDALQSILERDFRTAAFHVENAAHGLRIHVALDEQLYLDQYGRLPDEESRDDFSDKIGGVLYKKIKRIRQRASYHGPQIDVKYHEASQTLEIKGDGGVLDALFEQFTEQYNCIEVMSETKVHCRVM